jgi:arylsulfatase A-like enzyme
MAAPPATERAAAAAPAGKVWQSGVSSVDLMPTILDAAGVVPIMGAHGSDSRPIIHGRSLLAEVNGGRDDWNRPIMIQNVPQRAIDGAYYHERALRTERHKIILRKFDNRPVLRPGELYDMKADPAETRNLWDSAGPTVKQMAGLMAAWGEKYEDKLSVELGRWAADQG